jgi:uncharacterized protein
MKLREELNASLLYHGVHHTEEVIEVCEIRSKEEGFSDDDRCLLLVAALFHDSGFLIESKNHELHSCDLARKQLPEFGYSQEEIDYICRLIMTTRIPQSPFDKLSRILCDADLYYLGTSRYKVVSKNLRDELEISHGKMTEFAWLELQLDFLKSHQFHTEWAQKYLESKKQDRILELIQELNAL